MNDPFEELRPLLPGALQVFVSTWCWDCRKLEKFLAENDVPFDVVNINKSAQAEARLVAQTGKRGVPAVLVRDSTWVRGYHREAAGMFNADTFVRELAQALAMPGANP